MSVNHRSVSYDDGTFAIISDFPITQLRRGRALCSDGKVRPFKATGIARDDGTYRARCNIDGKTHNGEVVFERRPSGSVTIKFKVGAKRR